MNCGAASSLNFLLNSLVITVLNKMEFEKFMDFIYFSSFTLSVSFLDQLVTEISEPVLKGCTPSRNGSVIIVIFLHKVEERLS